MHGQLHISLGAGASVTELIGEGTRTSGAGIYPHLQGGAVTHRGHIPPAGLAERGCGEHVGVFISVVVDYRQVGGATCAHAVLVVIGFGRVVFVLVFFGGVLVALVGVVFLVLVFQLGFDLFPALYLNHVLIRQPQPTGFDVVEYDHVAVGAKHCLAGLVQCGNFTGQVIFGAGAVTQEATLPTPGRIHTASV